MKTMDCDWMREVNEKAHHTDEYETKCMVLRRGQTFNFKATLQRKFNDDFDSVVLELRTGLCYKYKNYIYISIETV